MPAWKKVIVSGSDAALNSLNVTTSLTASGLIYPAADNGEESFIQTDGNGNLSLQYVKTIYEEVVNGEATSIVKGTPVYVSGSVGAAAKVFRADASNASKMPVIYVVADTIAAAATGRGIALGLIKGVDTTGYPAGTEIYVAVGGGWTSTRPTGSAIVQTLGYVTKEGAGGMGVILNPGPNNLPNLPAGNVWVGNSNALPVATATSSIQNVVSASFATTAGSTAAALTAGTFLTSTGTFNGSTARTFAVDATNANIVSKVVARDASGNFSAGTITATLSGNASTATLVTGTSGQLQTKDDRIIEPNSITTGRLQFGFTSWNNNNGSPYADYLHLRSYTDGSGGNDNLVMFRKDALGMRIWQQAYGSATAYSSFKDVAWTDGTNASGNWTINVTGSLQGTASFATTAGSTTAVAGTTNYVSKFTSGTTIGNSQIFDNGTNVGIGTISPSQFVHISKTSIGGITTLLISNPDATSASTTSELALQTGLNSAAIRATSGAGGAGHLSFINEGSERVRIDSSGNVGIGTSTPTFKIDAVSNNSNILKLTSTGTASLEAGIELFSPPSDSITPSRSGRIYTKFDGPSFNTSRLTLQSITTGNALLDTLTIKNGNVGIGTTSPSEKLDVIGNIGVTGNILDTTASSFKWDTSGYLYAGNFPDPQGNLAYQVDAGIASITNQDSFDTSWIDNPSYNGQVLVAIAGETVVAGQLVYLRYDGSWYLAAATAVATATQLIGIALNGANANRGLAILLDGLIGISYIDQFGTITSGAPLYISTTAGYVSEAAPTGTGEIVRLVGHNIYENSSNYAVIRFQPDNSWIEL
jgi:hypothetical protein